ncbi:MAG: hypothetical protein ABSG53_31635 [Thermoguttaceae bacterium]|jgi:hypothetical protein
MNRKRIYLPLDVLVMMGQDLKEFLGKTLRGVHSPFSSEAPARDKRTAVKAIALKTKEGRWLLIYRNHLARPARMTVSRLPTHPR